MSVLITELPPALAELPWKPTPKATAPVDEDPIIVPGLAAPADRHLLWLPGEREEWVKTRPYGSWLDDGWEQAAEEFRNYKMSYDPTRAGFLAQAPEHIALPLLAEWRPNITWDFAHSLRPIVGRFGADARDAAFHICKSNASEMGPVLLPFLDVDVARQMADWRYRIATGRKIGAAWFSRHGLAAVPYLVPDALGKRRVPRAKAVAALRFIADEHGAGPVAEAARVHGDPAADAIARVLAQPAAPMPSDPRQPDDQAELPRLPKWADADGLPSPELRDGSGTLPPGAVRNLVTMLAMTRYSRLYPGLEDHLGEARAACDPGSLARFGWAVFEAWRGAGMPGRESWALDALGFLGDDETVRDLTPLIERWPGQSGHQRAVNGLDVLARIGTDTALGRLNRIAEKVKYQGLRARAREVLGRAAKARGLTADQLADRLVPDLGLDADGTLVLDYGPRRFVVGFDEQLKPYVLDESGKRRKDLPKPAAADDPELAPAAKARFTAVKKQARTVAADQIRRLETAMVEGRRWTAAEFRTHLLRHPLLWHITRRLVWLCEDGDRETGFRIAEDRTFTDVADDAFPLPDTALVSLAHPVELGGTAAAWAELFADYELLQPFAQLGRPVHAFTEEERKGTRLARFDGATVPTGRVLGLTRYGWKRGAPEDGGVAPSISVELSAGTFVLDLSPGIPVGAVDLFPEQKIVRASLGGRPGGCLGDLDEIIESELLLDLTALTETA